MKILAIDSSSLVASVAIATEKTVLAEYSINYKKTHSQTLLPMLDEIGKMIELEKNTLEAVAVTGGPGSFTGLRIGSATAKGIALALNIPIISVPTMDAMAYNLYGVNGVVCPIMDARRNQVYTGIYKFENGKMVTLKEQCSMGIEDLIEILNQIGVKVTFTGDGIEVYKDTINDNIKVPYEFPPIHIAHQRAGALAALAQLYAQEGKFETAAKHSPEYMRLSQAERERLANSKDL